LPNPLKAQNIALHRARGQLRTPAAAQNAAAPAAHDKATQPEALKPEKPAEPKHEKPQDTDFPAGSYVVRMDEPYSRVADMMLDTEYYNAHDPLSYDDTGWTLGALRNVKTTRVMDAAILDAPSSKVEGAIHVAGGVKGSGKV